MEFQRGPDAEKAYKQYNNRIIDGKNSMRVEVVVDPSRTAAAAIAAQPRGAVVAPVAAAAAARRQRGGAAGGRGGRGGPRRGGGAGGREKRPKKSLEDLDAEMEGKQKAWKLLKVQASPCINGTKALTISSELPLSTPSSTLSQTMPQRRPTRPPLPKSQCQRVHLTLALDPSIVQ